MLCCYRNPYIYTRLESDSWLVSGVYLDASLSLNISSALSTFLFLLRLLRDLIRALVWQECYLGEYKWTSDYFWYKVVIMKMNSKDRVSRSESRFWKSLHVQFCGLCKICPEKYTPSSSISWLRTHKCSTWLTDAIVLTSKVVVSVGMHITVGWQYPLSHIFDNPWHYLTFWLNTYLEEMIDGFNIIWLIWLNTFSHAYEPSAFPFLCAYALISFPHFSISLFALSHWIIWVLYILVNSHKLREAQFPCIKMRIILGFNC